MTETPVAPTTELPTVPEPSNETAEPAPGTPSAILADQETTESEQPAVPQGQIYGGELEQALEERTAKATTGEAKWWAYRGKYYRLRQTMPAGAVLAVMQAQRKQDAAKILESVVAFFDGDDGDRFIEAITDFSADVLIDMEYLQGLIRELFKAFGQRPLGK